MQQVIGTFSDSQAAQTAQHQLCEAGFPKNQIKINPQALDPNPPAGQTQAQNIAGGGAVIGSLIGAIVGVLFSLGSSTLVGISLPLAPIPTVLAASGIGAIAGGLAGALTGVSSPKAEMHQDRATLSHSYLLTVEGSEGEIQRAAEVLGQRQKPA